VCHTIRKQCNRLPAIHTQLRVAGESRRVIEAGQQRTIVKTILRTRMERAGKPGGYHPALPSDPLQIEPPPGICQLPGHATVLTVQPSGVDFRRLRQELRNEQILERPAAGSERRGTDETEVSQAIGVSEERKQMVAGQLRFY